MWTKVLPQFLELLSAILMTPALVGALFGDEKVTRAASWVRDMALAFAFLFQKPVLRTRFRLLYREKVVPRALFYQGIGCARKLAQLSEGRRATQEDIDELWREFSATLQASAEADPKIRGLLNDPDFEKTFLRLFGLLRDDDRPGSVPPLFESLCRRDWIKTFLRLGASLVWSLVPLTCLWWLLLQRWDYKIPLFGCSFVILLAIAMALAKTAYSFHMRTTLGLERQTRFPELINLPFIGPLDTLYLHYRLRRAARTAFTWAVNIVVVLLFAQMLGWIRPTTWLTTIATSILFGILITTSLITLVGLIALPVWVALAVVAWITVLGAWTRAARKVAATGALAFIAAKLLAAFT